MSSVITPLQHQIHPTLHSFYQLHSPTPIGDPDSPDERLRLETQRGLHHGPSSNWRNLHSTRRLYLACQSDNDLATADLATADATAAGVAVNAVGTEDGRSTLPWTTTRWKFPGCCWTMEQPQQYYNTDPGVYEPECDFYDSGQPDYPDTDEFLAQYAGGMTEDGLELPAEQNQGCTLSD